MTTQGVLSFRSLRAASLPAHKISTVESIDVARSYVASSVARWQGDEGARWRLTIAPSGMRLGRVDVNRLEKTSEAARERMYNAHMTVTPARSKRSTINSWSSQSRARMSYTLSTLDMSPLFENHGIPALVTLTMPRNWEQVTPTPKSFKSLVNKLFDRYRYAWGENLAGVWKLEFQKRGAPHVHLLMTPPTHRRPGTGETFSSWLAVNWAQLCQVKNMDWDDAEQLRMRVDHELMGTHIDYSKGLQGADTETVAAYFSKHGLFGAKDYQNEPPPIWREAVKLTGGVRFWGYLVLKKATGVIELNPITPHYVKRHSEGARPKGMSRSDYRATTTKEQRRALLRAEGAKPNTEDGVVRDFMRNVAKQRSYSRPKRVYRNRVNFQTGEIHTYRRKVNRRVKWMNGQAGFVNMRDGEASAFEVARLLAWHTRTTSARRPANPQWDGYGRVQYESASAGQ